MWTKFMIPWDSNILRVKWYQNIPIRLSGFWLTGIFSKQWSDPGAAPRGGDGDIPPMIFDDFFFFLFFFYFFLLVSSAVGHGHDKFFGLAQQ